MKKVLTIILDGFGMREEFHGNAIKDANMTFFNSLWEKYPHALLNASEEYVGLKEGQFGNSETGHQTIGAGRLIKQKETLVTEFLESDILDNLIFQKLLENKDKKIHLMGLCSDGCVHASIEHMLKLHEILVKNGFNKIYFHLITDGRDTDVKSSIKYIKMVEDSIKKLKVGVISSVCGRYYAMDRNKNYDRTKKYYDLITRGIGIVSNNIENTIKHLYDKDITDEFIPPIILNEDGVIRNKEVLIWLNYRADRAKQILSTFADSLFSEFKVYNTSEMEIYTFLPIDEKIPTYHFIEEQRIDKPLGIYLSALGLTQARIAESEKFPHVTYFFDGEYDGKIEKCNKFHIPSPNVETYDLKPEMSAVSIVKKCMECMTQDYDFILLNFANPDMVGHTGNYKATVTACITVDMCLEKLVEIAHDNFYKVIILADHGNADMMLDGKNNIVTTHTLSKVPFIILDNKVELKEDGDLTMVAPTILEYMDIALPDEMKDTPILIKK